MTDDWSLKDKIIYEDGSGWSDEWVYKKEDIETLRQKLIDDITEYGHTLSAKCDDPATSLFLRTNFSYFIEEIINKRFGKEK